jgi:DNA-binding response OmpR family regulator
MTTPIFQALIVDDEPISCKMMTFALAQENFSCDAAKDGDEALGFCRHREYDLVVTDLVMPNRNGHSLAVDLLAAKSRPVVIVHTSVNEPRLTKDLLLRGVDEVVYKPTNYKALALRAATLVAERKSKSPKNTEQDFNDGGMATVDVTDFENRLANVTKKIPLSPAAYMVFGLVDAVEIPASRIAECLASDATLIAEVLRLADGFYRRNNPSGKSIANLEEAVLCVGQKRVAELALAVSAFSALTAKPAPWLNVDLAWQRSIAASVAMDMILTRGVYPGIGSGLFLNALTHLFGRIVLGLSYPEPYRQMIEHCKTGEGTIDEIEEHSFTLNHGQVLRSLFKAWNLPETVSQPLGYTAKSFSVSATLSEPMRTKVELLKMAIFIGQIAVGKWDVWDAIDFPTTSVLKRLQIDSLSKIIEDTRTDMKLIIRGRPQDVKPKDSLQEELSNSQILKVLGYCNLSAESFDFLREIVTSMGINLIECVPNALEPNRNFLVNCLWNPPQRFNSTFPTSEPYYGAKLIVTDPNHVTFYGQSGNVITLPTCFGTLQAACNEIARHTKST